MTKLVMRGGAAAAEDGTSTVAHEKGAGAVMALSFVPRRGGDDSDDARPPLLLAAYEEGTVALWDPNRRAAANEENEDESPLWRDRVHEDAATCVAADADGAGFVTGGADGRVCAFSLAFDAAATTTTPTATVTMRHAHGPYTPSANVADRARWGGRAAGAGVSDVAIRGDGKLVAASSSAFYTLVPIRPRSRGERRSLRTLPGASLRPPLAFNPRPRRLSTPTDAFQLHPDVALYGTTSRDGRVRVYAYRGKTPKTLASLAFHSDVVTSVAFAGVGGGEDDGGGVLASASRDGCVALWPVFPTAGK